MPDKFNMSDVMISYSRKDKAFVQKLEHAIAKTGRNTWVDWDDIPPTADWWAEIKAGIEAAHTFIFIISPNSVNSDICHQEIDHAVLHNKRIVPIVYQDVSNPADQAKMHPALSSHNWIMFRAEDDTRQSFRTLIRALETDLAHTRQHTRLLVLASEWDERGRPNSLLLRGEDLREAENWLANSEGKNPKPTQLQREYINASHKAAAALLRFIAGLASFVMLVLVGITAFAIFKAIQANNLADAVIAANGNVQVAQTKVADAAYAQEMAAQAQFEALTAAALADKNLASSNSDLTEAAYQQETAESAKATAQAAQETADAGLLTANAGATDVAYQALTSQANANKQATAAAIQQNNAADAQTEGANQQAEANAQATEAAQQKANAEQAQEDANTAQQEADQAQEAADQAQQNAANAQATANAAGADAINAQATAYTAAIEAANALVTANAAASEAAQQQALADAAANQAAILEEQNLDAYYIELAENALDGGNRPLAIHYALLAIDRPNMTQAVPDNILRRASVVIYSPGLEYTFTPGNYGYPTDVVVSHDGKYAVASTINGYLLVLNLSNFNITVYQSQTTYNARINDIDIFDVNGIDYILSGEILEKSSSVYNNVVQIVLWKLDNGALSMVGAPMKVNNNWLSNVTFVDGEYIATRSEEVDQSIAIDTYSIDISIWKWSSTGIEPFIDYYNNCYFSGLYDRSGGLAAYRSGDALQLAIGIGGRGVILSKNLNDGTANFQCSSKNIGILVRNTAFYEENGTLYTVYANSSKLLLFETEKITDQTTTTAIPTLDINFTTVNTGFLEIDQESHSFIAGGVSLLAGLGKFTSSDIQILESFTGHTGTITGGAFIPESNGKRFVTSSTDGTIRLWKGTNSGYLARQSFENPVQDVDFVPCQTADTNCTNWKRILVSTSPHTAYLWATTNNSVTGIPSFDGFQIDSGSASRDGKYFAIASASYNHGKIFLWPIDNHASVGKPFIFDNTSGVSGYTIHDIDFLSDNRVIAPLAPYNNYENLYSLIRLYEPPDTKKDLIQGASGIHTLSGRTYSIDLSADDSVIVTGSTSLHGDDASVQVFIKNGASYTLTKTYCSGCANPDKVAISPDGNLVATRVGTTIYIYNRSLASTDASLTLIGHSATVNDLAFINNTVLISIGNDHTIRLWNLTSGNQIQTINTNAIPTSLDVHTKSGKYFVTGMNDNTAIVWQIRDLQELIAFACNSTVYIDPNVIGDYVHPCASSNLASVTFNSNNFSSVAPQPNRAAMAEIPTATPFTPTPSATPVPAATATPTALPPPYILLEPYVGDWHPLSDRYGFVAINNNSLLHTPYSIDLSQYSSPVLKFNSLRTGVQGLGIVEISVNGAEWQMLDIVDTGAIEIDLSQYLGQHIDLQFAWFTPDGIVESWQIEEPRIENMAIVPTATPIQEITATPSPTLTLAPTAETTVESTVELIVPTATYTATATLEVSATPTLTASPTMTNTATITASPTMTNTSTLTATATVTVTPSQTASPTQAVTPGAIATAIDISKTAASP